MQMACWTSWSIRCRNFPGFPASEILYNNDGSVRGVVTQDMGIDKEGNKKDSFEPGIELGKVTVFAEGCRGHLGKQLIKISIR